MQRVIYSAGIGLILIILVFIYSPALKEYTVLSAPGQKVSFEEVLHNRLINDLNILKVPAIQVSIILNDKETDLAIGTEDYDRKLEITNAHVFRVGSITKLYTAVIVLKLIENGSIQLDDTVNKWFYEIPNCDKITIKDLLNHTSGIYNYTEGYIPGIKTALFTRKVWRAEELYKLITKGNPYFRPGENHYYSNSNYILLGLIAEKVTGKRYQTLLHEVILDELKLGNTYLLPDDKSPDFLITGYDRDLIPLGTHKITPENKSWASFAYSAGGIVSTSGDIAQFLKALFTNRIIKKETIDKMQEFYNFKDEDIPEQTGYGLGLRKLVIENDTLIGHTGTIPGFGGAAFYCPEKDYYITVLGNISALNQAYILRTIVKTTHEFWHK